MRSRRGHHRRARRSVGLKKLRAISRRSTVATPLASCTLAIKASPKAPRNAVVGWLSEALKIKVHAPALEGRVNDVLCEFLADTLALPRRAVTVLQGHTSRQKVLHVSGLTLAEVRAKLGV